MKFIKQHWIFILVITILVVLFFRNRSEMSDYRDEIKIKDDSIANLYTVHTELESQILLMQDSLETSQSNELLYQDSLKLVEEKNEIDKQKYEDEIANIVSIPTDSLYLDISRWLDSR